MEEIVRVVQTIMEHYIPLDINIVAGTFQLPTLSQEGSIPPALLAPKCVAQSAPTALQTNPSSRSHIPIDDDD
ncbi:hypothetical protein Dimus_007855, partial [Dionaea muscipula]